MQLSTGTVDLDALRFCGPRGDEALTERECELLVYLANHADRVIPRRELLTEVWGYAPTVRSRAVDSTVQRLRSKIEEDPASPAVLLSVYGQGYRLVVADTRTSTPSALVGRDALVARVSAALSAPGCHALWGPGGVGKTSLARQVARAHAAEVVWVDLSSTADAADAAARMGRALGLRGARAADPDSQALALQSRSGVLLVIDDAERVIDSICAFVPAWVDAGARVLVTSRVRRDALPGTDVPTLALDDAEALFHARARRPCDADAVRALVAALAGLPLAIELAAARAHLVPVADLVPTRSVALLAQPGEGRHASLDAVLDASWQPLSDDAHRVLEAVAAHAEPVAFDDLGRALSLDAVRLVAAVEEAVGASVLRAVPGPRYTLLPLVRTWVRQDQARRVRGDAAHHRAWRDAPGDAFDEWLRVLSRARLDTIDDVPACADALLAASRTVPIPRLPDLLDGALHLAQRASPAARARLHLVRAGLYLRLGPRRDAAAHLDAAETLGLSAYDTFRARLWRANLHRSLGDAVRAEAAYRDVRSEGPADLGATATIDHGLLAKRQGRMEEARGLFVEAAARCAEVGDSRGEALAWGNLAGLLRASGATDEAERMYREAAAALEPGDPMRPGLLNNLGTLFLVTGRTTEAAQAYEQAQEVAGQQGQAISRAFALQGLASLDLAAGYYTRAEVRLLQVVALQSRQSDPRATNFANTLLGHTRHIAGRADAQAPLLAARLPADAPMTPHGALTECILALCLAEAGDVDAADEALHRAAPQAEHPEVHPLFRAASWCRQAAVDPVGARQALLRDVGAETWDEAMRQLAQSESTGALLPVLRRLMQS